MSTPVSFTYIAVCDRPECDFVENTNAKSPYPVRSSASRHAWNHHHAVTVYQCDLTAIAAYDHEGISAQPALF